MSSVEIKVMTVVMTKKVNACNGLYGLSSMSSLKIYIPLCRTNMRLHISDISRNKKAHIQYIYCCFFSDDIDDIDDNHYNPLFSNYNQVSSLILSGFSSDVSDDK